MRCTPLRSVALVVSTLALGALVAPQATPSAHAGSGTRLAACPDADLLRAPAPQARKAIVCLVNAVRQGRGLRTLVVSRTLDRAAALKLADEVRCGAFSHTPCGEPFTGVFDAVGYTAAGSGWTVGENLALGHDAVSTPRSVMDAWLDSPAHRKILLSPGFRELGVAVARPGTFLGRSGPVLWATAFGAR